MNALWQIVAAEFAERAAGPMALRLLLQPTIAAILAIRSGLRDAAAGRAPFGWRVLTDPAHRAELIRDGWKGVGTVFLLAIGLDLAYQVIAGGAVVPRQSVILALLIALLPYLILRGLTTRIAHAVRRRGA
jgi:hypothetical protein